jgi:hypothetical protein
LRQTPCRAGIGFDEGLPWDSEPDVHLDSRVRLDHRQQSVLSIVEDTRVADDDGLTVFSK